MNLALIAFTGALEQKYWSLFLRGVGVVPFLFVLYWLIQFGKWSTETEGGEPYGKSIK